MALNFYGCVGQIIREMRRQIRRAWQCLVLIQKEPWFISCKAGEAGTLTNVHTASNLKTSRLVHGYFGAFTIMVKIECTDRF
jgi:hypothetical protein